MATVARCAAVVVVLASSFVACSDDDAVTTSTAGSSTVPAATHTMAPTPGEVLGWEPAHEVPADQQANLAALLSENGAWMLVPSAPPIEGPTSAEVTSLVPWNDPSEVTYNLVVRPVGSGEVVLSLSSSTADLDPCRSLFPDYSPIGIRGVEGCALIVDGGVDFLNWVEDGRWFHATWDEIDLGGVVSWLETWRPIP